MVFSHAAPVIFTRSLPQSKSKLTNICPKGSKLCTIYDHPYDAVDSIKQSKLAQAQSPEMIITLNPKCEERVHQQTAQFMAEIVQNQNPQQSSTIIRDVHEALNAFLSQQSHILIFISPYTSDFSVTEVQSLPQFDQSQITKQLSQRREEEKIFGSKLPKHIIVLNSKNNHCNFLILKRMMETKQAEYYGDLFKLSVECASSIAEIKELIQTIKMQQHQLQIDQVIRMENVSDDAVKKSADKRGVVGKKSRDLHKSLAIRKFLENVL